MGGQDQKVGHGQDQDQQVPEQGLDRPSLSLVLLLGQDQDLDPGQDQDLLAPGQDQDLLDPGQDQDLPAPGQDQDLLAQELDQDLALEPVLDQLLRERGRDQEQGLVLGLAQAHPKGHGQDLPSQDQLHQLDLSDQRLVSKCKMYQLLMYDR